VINNKIDELIFRVSDEFNGILRANLYEIGLNDDEMTKLKKRKREMRTALKNCGIGDLDAKNYIKSCIKDILIKKINITEENIEEYISFSNVDKLSVREKFDILLYCYKKEEGDYALVSLCDKYRLAEPVQNKDNSFSYYVSVDAIEDIFEEERIYLSFVDKLEILVQRVYAGYKGLGVIDELRDMVIDGISGGVSGTEDMLNSIWIFIKGKTVHLQFLEFESEKELERICMNIYRFGYPGQFSMARGYVVNEMKDHSRVVVVRPPFSESFAFFVRKFNTIENHTVKELLTDEGSDIVENVIKFIVKGCRVVGITGAQGSGKTTMLMALIGFIHPAYTLRIQEMAFELHLREVYPDRNILTFRETDTVNGQDALDLQKKTDGTVNILGEVASAPVSSWLVQMSMVGSLFTMFTHHAKTTKALIKYMRNCLLSHGAFTNERIAEEQVVDAINFDIHMEKDIKGHRYIERITEIVPLENSSELYRTRDIVRYIDGRYILGDKISENTKKEIFRYLSSDEQEEYNVIFGL